MNTSRAAFIKIQPSARETRAKIMDFATQRGARGFVVDELVEAWRCSANHVAPRVVELVRASELIPTGRRRPTRTGCSAQIYVAARFAQPAPAPDTPTFPELGILSPEGRYPE
jgi:hypothetical protein